MTERILKLKDEAVGRYGRRETIAVIASALQINIKTVRRLLRNSGVEIRGSKKNLIGQPFERLSVVRYVGVDKSQKCLWECDCICGNKTIVRGSDLISRKVKSCGCYHSETSRENIKASHKKYPKSYGFKGIGDIPGGYLSRIKHGAFIRNFEYSVSKEYLWDLFLKQNRKCAMTGLDLTFGKWNGGTKENGTASLDRIDSSRGYVGGNVQWVHKDINNIKQDYNLSEFLGYCKLVTDYEKRKHT
jgi:hypothetical protein